MNKVSTLIIGAGPTGLGAAWRLNQQGIHDWLICDRAPYVGGLAASFKDDKGFTWDFAVHVAHSHYRYVDQLMDELLPDGFYHHQRKSWVRLYGCWVPYPFQYNFHRLPPAVRDECIRGLKNRAATSCNMPLLLESQSKSFREWIYNSFGEGIARHFMVPYNQKIWTVDPAEMSSHWLGDRVPTVDMAKVEESFRTGIDNVGWGPNATFQFPKSGGTGAIWRAMASRLPDERVKLSCGVTSINLPARTACLADGTLVRFDKLVSTIPLKVLAKILGRKEWVSKTARLKHSHVQVAGLAVYRKIPQDLVDKTWVYCPESSARFYRVTPFSTFSPNHTPDPETNCSFLCEFATPGDAPMLGVDLGVLAREGLKKLGFIDIASHESHTYTMAADYGYPVPTLDRDEILHDVLPAMQSEGIYSRGRFGAWKYEVANMDHSVMQGVEAVNHILHGQEELTVYHPAVVNRGKM